MSYKTGSPSTVGVLDSEPTRQRPVLVWFILAIIAFGVVTTPFTLWSAQNTYVDPPLHLYVVTFVSLAIQLVGAVALFRLRTVALKLFAATLILSVVFGTYLIVFLPALKVPPGTDEATTLTVYRTGAIVGLVFGVVLWAAILAYLRRLQRRGILR